MKMRKLVGLGFHLTDVARMHFNLERERRKSERVDRESTKKERMKGRE